MENIDKMKHVELRQKFFDYFKSRGHEIVASSPLVPIDDPTLLFTTAGMVQFKPLYAGIKEANYKRAASIQKCFRLSDLEQIGKTLRHHTFFEMFGNFAFMGDYFKKEAIEFAWEFSTSIIGLPKDKIYISVFESDDDAFELWHKHIGIDKSHIVRLGKADNFWGPAGDSGACGPCSELYIDMGQDKGCEKDDCFVGCDCERYLEFWNLVFNEFFQDTDGIQTPLPNVGIDTGMGLERLLYITQGVESNYQTDVMKPIVSSISNTLNVKYEGKNKEHINLIADHLRALVFVISENINPSNEGRGYVLKRLLRNALKTASDIGMKEPFLHSITDSVVNTYSPIYDYLKKEESNVKDILLLEEKKFYQTVLSGLSKLDDIINEKKEDSLNTISGQEAFILFDTFGLPLDITIEEAKKKGFDIDKNGFDKEMEKQRIRSRGIDENKKDKYNFIENIKTEYIGEDYKKISNGIEANIIAIYEDEKSIDRTNKKEAIIITDATIFYAEMGGQVGDIGLIETANSQAKVLDTKKKNATIIHIVEIVKGEFSKNEKVSLKIDIDRHNAIRKNHTATHTLQRVLINKLGSHIKQAGSFVSEKYLRFDFTHFKAIEESELINIEASVNESIAKNYKVNIAHMNKNDAIKHGALALFDEKYGENVRVLTIGENAYEDGNFSCELCGGSHVDTLSDIGYFHIVSESSIASGVRRIEAITGLNAAIKASEALYINKSIIKNMSLNAPTDIKPRIGKFNADIKNLQKEIKELKSGSNANINFLDKFEKINDIIYYELYFDEDMATVRGYLDIIKERVKDHVAIAISSFKGTNSVFVQANGNALTKNISAVDILKSIQAKAQGRGGGKQTFAQGSIEDIEAAKKVIEDIKNNI